jgi:predicted DNA-binding helix-hairpin-helix protein
MDMMRRLEILADAAKYNASCASSGTELRDSPEQGASVHRSRQTTGHSQFHRLMINWPPIPAWTFG